MSGAEIYDRMRLLTELATSDHSPPNMPAAALKYRWLAFYPVVLDIEVSYLSAGGKAASLHVVHAIGIAQDSFDEPVLGAFEYGRFKAFYIDRIRDVKWKTEQVAPLPRRAS